jgi:hypothetical protein
MKSALEETPFLLYPFLVAAGALLLFVMVASIIGLLRPMKSRRERTAQPPSDGKQISKVLIVTRRTGRADVTITWPDGVRRYSLADSDDFLGDLRSHTRIEPDYSTQRRRQALHVGVIVLFPLIVFMTGLGMVRPSLAATAIAVAFYAIAAATSVWPLLHKRSARRDWAMVFMALGGCFASVVAACGMLQMWRASPLRTLDAAARSAPLPGPTTVGLGNRYRGIPMVTVTVPAGWQYATLGDYADCTVFRSADRLHPVVILWRREGDVAQWERPDLPTVEIAGRPWVVTTEPPFFAPDRRVTWYHATFGPIGTYSISIEEGDPSDPRAQAFLGTFQRVR